jgi:hypothetical protein
MKRSAAGWTKAEVLVAFLIAMVGVAAAWPNMLKVSINGNQKAAVSTLATLSMASSLYYRKHRIYPKNLKALQEYVQNEEAVNTEYPKKDAQGYCFILKSKPPHDRFLIFAVPMTYEKTGRLSFVVSSNSDEIFETNLRNTPPTKQLFFQSENFPDPKKPLWYLDEDKLVLGGFTSRKWSRTLIDSE